MAKKTIEAVIKQLRETVLNLSAAYAVRLMDDEGDPITKDEKSQLKEMKAELKFIENLHNQLEGKTGKEKKIAESSIVEKINHVKTSIGAIVVSIPKNVAVNE